MPPGDIERFDAIVLGASMRGLVTTHVLQSLGYRVALIERGRAIGGADGSFVTPGGATFDHGLHVLDFMRSELATRLFTSVVDGRVHRQVLRRAIAIRGHVMPYDPAPSAMPDELRALLPGDELVDDLGDELPTRPRLARVYGARYTDLIFDEVLPSYPTEARHLAFGVDEGRLLANIYPWFFPHAARPAAGGDLSRSFHDRLRAGIEQEILYPEEGGFAGFAQGFVRGFDPARVELLTGAADPHVEVRAGSHDIDWVAAGGRRFAALHVFWAGPWPMLCELLGLPCQHVATDRVVLGNFRLNRPAETAYHEILVGDPSMRINRVSFPASFRRSHEPLLQVEFAYPLADDRMPSEAAAWRETWVDDLTRLGVLRGDHAVEEFDFRAFTMHFNGFGAEGEVLVDADPALVDPHSNLHPVVPSMANLNLNAYVPRVVSEVTARLAKA